MYLENIFIYTKDLILPHICAALNAYLVNVVLGSTSFFLRFYHPFLIYNYSIL